MRRYTTPQQELFIPDATLEGATVYVTFADKDNNVLLTVENASVEDSNDGSTVTVTLTQEQTAMFKADEFVNIQVNWLTGGKRYATEIVTVPCGENLLQEIL